MYRNMTSIFRAPYTLNAHQRPTVGDSKFSVINNDHMGWLKCDGRTLPVTDFYALWRVIGYSFGGGGDSFQLPNAAGTVPGVVGTGRDSNTNASTMTFTLGQQVGEYNHTLTIDQMPTHNHGVEEAEQPNNNQTSASLTGVTVNTNTTGVYDSGHAHSYVRPNTDDNTYTAEPGNTPTGGGYNATTGSNSANIVDPQHNHGITDPTHYHTINAAGGSNYHNNVQPTLPIGNMFMYCGISYYPSNGFPYTAGTNIL